MQNFELNSRKLGSEHSQMWWVSVEATVAAQSWMDQNNILQGAVLANVLQSVSWSLVEFRHNKIVQSPHENYFNVCRQHKEKRDLVKMTIIQTG